MICNPTFRYFLANEKYPVRSGDSRWTTALPAGRTPPVPSPTGESFTYGEYFNAVRRFLDRHDCRAVVAALSCGGHGNVRAGLIQAIRIFLVKHGQYYHPARIEIVYAGIISSFVLNVAISADAREMIKAEGSALEFLCNRFPYDFLPKVYAIGEVCTDGGRTLGMFLGQWFDDYHEFHLSRGAEERQHRIIIWDGKPVKCFLSSRQTRAVYKQAALILTAYYNLTTFEQVSAWHHAAGDFVIKLDKDELAMKLITVRQYAPLIENSAPDLRTILEALQLFLLNLSLHMRLDRLDGVGVPVWAGETAVAGTVDGFFKGLVLQVTSGLIPGEIVGACREYLSVIPRREWMEKMVSVVDRWRPGLPDLPLIRRNLGQHAACLHKSVANAHGHHIKDMRRN